MGRSTVATCFIGVLCMGSAFAQSSRPQVIKGSAHFEQGGNDWTITTNKNKTIINWQNFDVPSGSTTTFNQPHKSSAVLNRVTGALASGIYGSLLSNGKVFLINPNGIVVGKQGVIDTHGFVASTLDVADAQFLRNSTLAFSGSSEAAIVNMGKITASGEDIILIASRVENHGSLTARHGKVGLAAGREILLTKDNQIFIRPAGDSSDATGIWNTGGIEGMQAELKAYGSMYALAINNEGDILATGAVLKNGSVLLRAEGGTIRDTGKIQAQTNIGPGVTAGGTIQILADKIILEGSASIDVSGDTAGGHINIGGSYQGQGPLPNSELIWVGSDVSLKANALLIGDGGTIILWADHSQWFHGHAEAKGGAEGGRGGLVEVSGKQFLEYRGQSDLTASKGEWGVLLLDPASGVISNGSDDGAADGNTSFSGSPSGTVGQILVGDSGPTVIFESELEAMASSANVIIQMTGDLTLQNLSDNVLALNLNSGSLSLIADADGNGSGTFQFADVNDTIRTEGGAVHISGAQVILGGINTTGVSDTKSGGGITVDLTNTANRIGLAGNIKALDATIRLNKAAEALGSVTLDASGTGQIAVGDITTTNKSHDLVLKAGTGGLGVSNLGSGATPFDEITLQSQGGVSQSAGSQIHSDKLQLAGTGTFDLSTNVNTVGTTGTLATGLSITNAKTISIGNTGLSVSGDLRITTLSGSLLTDHAITASGLITLNAVGAISGTGLVSGTGLLIMSASRVNLNTAVDTVATAALGSALINIANNKKLTVGTLGGQSGVSSQGGIGISTGGGGDLVLSQSLDGGSSSINLQWEGSLQFASGVSIKAAVLNIGGPLGTGLNLNLNEVGQINTIGVGLTGSGTVQISSNQALTTQKFVASNSVVAVQSKGWLASQVTAQALALQGDGVFDLGTTTQTLAAQVRGELTVNNQGALKIGTVQNLSGVETGGETFLLVSTGALSLESKVNLGAGEFSLNVIAGGATQQNGGTIQAGSLDLIGKGDITFDNSENRVPLLAADVTDGNFILHTQGNLTITDVGNLSGIKTSNASLISLRADHGFIDVQQPILSSGVGSPGRVVVSGDIRSDGPLGSVVVPLVGLIELNAQARIDQNLVEAPPESGTQTPDPGADQEESGQEESGQNPDGGNNITNNLNNRMPEFESTSLGIDSQWELKLPLELVAVTLTLSRITNGGFEDQYLPIIKEEIDTAQGYYTAATRMLVAISPLYHGLPDDDPAKAEIAQSIRALKYNQLELKVSVKELDYFLERLYLLKMRDRVNQDSFNAALSDLSLANGQILISTAVVQSHEAWIRRPEAWAATPSRLEGLKIAADQATRTVRETRKTALALRDGVFKDVLLFSWEE